MHTFSSLTHCNSKFMLPYKTFQLSQGASLREAREVSKATVQKARGCHACMRFKHMDASATCKSFAFVSEYDLRSHRYSHQPLC